VGNDRLDRWVSQARSFKKRAKIGYFTVSQLRRQRCRRLSGPNGLGGCSQLRGKLVIVRLGPCYDGYASAGAHHPAHLGQSKFCVGKQHNTENRERRIEGRVLECERLPVHGPRINTERLRRGRERVQILLLQALARQRLGEDGVPALREAVSLAEEYGLLRILADTHPDLPAWAAQLQGNAPAAAAQSAAAPVPPRKHSTVSVSPSRMLTPKEREVLQLLARNLSNKQIALALEVGEETVKWHMKNLFGKFQAGTRKHVLDRAYLLGILQP